MAAESARLATAIRRPSSRARADASHEQHLRALYIAFNARDIDAVLAALADDVDWPTPGGRRLRGRDEVRDCGRRRWSAIDPRVEPPAINGLRDGRVSVDGQQAVSSLGGELLDERRVRHVYELHDGFIARMDVEEPP